MPFPSEEQFWLAGWPAYIDAQQGTLTLTGTTADNRIASDATSGATAFAGTLTDARLYTDAQSGALAAAGSVTSTAAYTDASAGATSVTGANSDAATTNDTPIGIAVLAGSIIEQATSPAVADGTGGRAWTPTGHFIPPLPLPISHHDRVTGHITITGEVAEEDHHIDPAPPAAPYILFELIAA